MVLFPACPQTRESLNFSVSLALQPEFGRSQCALSPIASSRGRFRSIHDGRASAAERSGLDRFPLSPIALSLARQTLSLAVRSVVKIPLDHLVPLRALQTLQRAHRRIMRFSRSMSSEGFSKVNYSLAMPGWIPATSSAGTSYPPHPVRPDKSWSALTAAMLRHPAAPASRPGSALCGTDAAPRKAIHPPPDGIPPNSPQSRTTARADGERERSPQVVSK